MLVRFISNWGDYAIGEVGDFPAPDAKRLVALHLAREMEVGESKAIEAPPMDKSIRSAPKVKAEPKPEPEPTPVADPVEDVPIQPESMPEPKPPAKPEQRRRSKKGSDE